MLLWGGLVLSVLAQTTITSLTHFSLATPIGHAVARPATQFGHRIVLELVILAPLIVAVVVLRVSRRRTAAAMFPVALAGLLGYLFYDAAATQTWIVAVAIDLLLLAAWLIARERAAISFALLVPAAAVQALWWMPKGSGSWLRDLAYNDLGWRSAFPLGLWSTAHVLFLVPTAMAAALLSQGRRPVMIGDGTSRGPLLAMVAVAVSVVAVSVAAVSHNDHSGASTPFSVQSEPADSVGQALGDQVQSGVAPYAGCDGSSITWTMRSYTIGASTPAANGTTMVAVTIVLADGTQLPVSYRVTDSTGLVCYDGQPVP